MSHLAVAKTYKLFIGGAFPRSESGRTYLAEGSNANRTAARTFTHRNTVLNRLGRAEQLLPAPLDGRRLQVALALEITRWRA